MFHPEQTGVDLQSPTVELCPRFAATETVSRLTVMKACLVSPSACPHVKPLAPSVPGESEPRRKKFPSFEISVGSKNNIIHGRI